MPNTDPQANINLPEVNARNDNARHEAYAKVSLKK